MDPSKLKMRKLVTGGAGFIGSHLVDKLMKEGHSVRVLDNLSSGKIENFEKWLDEARLEFIKEDLLNIEDVQNAVSDCDVIYHLAANPEVDAKKASPEAHFRQNIQATFNILEAIRNQGDVQRLVFTSSSTIYGDADQFPTPEDYGPLKPISLYGASKLSCEGLISAYSSMYGFRSNIYRLANVVGPRSDHGVIFDFIGKIRENPHELEVLGDGSQSKSYLYISDCIKGLISGEKSDEKVSIFNMGSEDRINVLEIANIVREETGNESAKIKLTGGVDGGRGWRGDVKVMQLDMTKLKELGWKPEYSSTEAVKLTTRAIFRSSK